MAKKSTRKKPAAPVASAPVSTSISWQEHLRWLGGVSAAFWLAVAVVGVGGDYPLNDDWAYAWSARHLLETGQLRILDWLAPVPVLPAAWGALALAVSNSFVSLRVGNLLWAWAAVLLLYAMGRRSQFTAVQACTWAAAVGLSPWFVNLAFTFMTDICMFACIVAGLFCLMPRVGSLRPNTWAVALAGVAIAMAELTRQFGVLPLPGMLLCTAWWDRRANLPMGQRVARGAALVLPAAVCAAVTQHWYLNVHGPTVAYSGTVMRMSQAMPLQHLGAVAHYFGLWVLPWVLGVLLARRWRQHLAWAAAVPSAGLLVGYAVYAAQHLPVGQPVGFDVGLPPFMPYLSNLVYRVGSGPLTLPDTFFGAMPHLHDVDGLGLVLSAASTVGGVFALGWLWRAAVGMRKNLSVLPDGRGQMLALLLVTTATYLGFLMLTSSLIFDRYLLLALPTVAWVAVDACRDGSAQRYAVFAGIAAMAVFSLGSTREYLAWNNARAAAVAQLQQEGVPTSAIDAGFEWNEHWRFERFFQTYHALYDSRPFTFLSRGTRYHLVFWPQTPPPWLGSRTPCREHSQHPFWTWPGTAARAVYVLDCQP